MASLPVFSSVSPRFGLPLLYAAQAQKELCVNEALAVIDAMLGCAVEGIATVPPASPVNGTNWLVGSGGTGAWAGRDGSVAACQAGNWVFIAPRDGMNVLNRATGQTLLYAGGWQAPAQPAAPAGGATVDVEARTAIAALIAALQQAGIFSTS